MLTDVETTALIDDIAVCCFEFLRKDENGKMAYEELKLPQLNEKFPYNATPFTYCNLYTEDDRVSVADKLHELMYKKDNEQFYSELMKPRCSVALEQKDIVCRTDSGNAVTNNSNSVNDSKCEVPFNPFGLASLFPSENMFSFDSYAYDLTKYSHQYPMHYPTQEVNHSTHDDISKIIQNTANLNRHLQLLQPNPLTEVNAGQAKINMNSPVTRLEITSQSLFQAEIDMEKQIEEKRRGISKGRQKANNADVNQAEIKPEENTGYESECSRLSADEEFTYTSIENMSIDNSTYMTDHLNSTFSINTATNIGSTDGGTMEQQDNSSVVNIKLPTQIEVQMAQNFSQMSDAIIYNQTDDVSNVINMIDPTNDIESNMFIKTESAHSWVETPDRKSETVNPVISTIIQPTNMLPETKSAEVENVIRAIEHKDDLLEHVLPDAFTLWQRKFRELVEEEYPEATKKVIAEKLKEVWGKLPDKHRSKYYSMADAMVQKYKKNLAASNKVKNIWECDKSVVRPTPVRITAENGQKDDVISSAEPPIDDVIMNSSTHVDISKAMKESMTYYSTDKYAKRRIRKRKVAEVSTDLADENEIATGYLEDIMMVNNGKFDEKLSIEYDYGEECERLLLNEGPIDVSELDRYLAGEDTYQLGCQVEIESQTEDEEELQGKEERKKTKRVMQTKRRLQRNRQRLLDVREKLANKKIRGVNKKYTGVINAEANTEKIAKVKMDEIDEKERHNVASNDEKKSTGNKRCTRQRNNLTDKCKTSNNNEEVKDDKPEINVQNTNDEKVEEREIIQHKNKSCKPKRKPCRRKLKL